MPISTITASVSGEAGGFLEIGIGTNTVMHCNSAAVELFSVHVVSATHLMLPVTT